MRGRFARNLSTRETEGPSPLAVRGLRSGFPGLQRQEQLREQEGIVAPGPEQRAVCGAFDLGLRCVRRSLDSDDRQLRKRRDYPRVIARKERGVAVIVPPDMHVLAAQVGNSSFHSAVARLQPSRSLSFCSDERRWSA